MCLNSSIEYTGVCLWSVW